MVCQAINAKILPCTNTLGKRIKVTREPCLKSVLGYDYLESIAIACKYNNLGSLESLLDLPKSYSTCDIPKLLECLKTQDFLENEPLIHKIAMILFCLKHGWSNWENLVLAGTKDGYVGVFPDKPKPVSDFECNDMNFNSLSEKANFIKNNQFLLSSFPISLLNSSDYELGP